MMVAYVEVALVALILVAEIIDMVRHWSDDCLSREQRDCGGKIK